MRQPVNGRLRQILLPCLLVLSIAAAGVVLPSSPAAAATVKTWVGPSNGLWSTAANWSPAGAPENGDSVVFNGSSSSRYDLGDRTIANLTTGQSAVSVFRTAGGGTLSVSGDINVGSEAELDVPLHLPAGVHEVSGPGKRLVEVSGPGTLRSTGGMTLGTTTGFTGQLQIVAGNVGTTDGVGSVGTGTSIAPGAELFLQYFAASQGEPITVLAGAGPAARLTIRRSGSLPNVYTGAISLEGDLEVTDPATFTGAITGPGALTLGVTVYTNQLSVLSGSVDVGSLVLEGDVTVDGHVDAEAIEVQRRLTVSGTQALGTAPVTVTATGSITVLTGGSLANPLSFTVPSTVGNINGAGLQLGDGAELTGTVNVSGTTFLRVIVVGDATIAEPITSSVTLDLQGVTFQPSHLQMASSSTVPAMYITSLVVDVDDVGGGQSLGTIQVIAGLTSPVLGTFTFGASGQHDPATQLRVAHTGLMDLYGTDQSASLVSVSSSAYLALGVSDASVDVSKLTVTGPLSADPGSLISFVLGASGNDQISAQSVRLGGDFWFVHDGTAAPGQVFRIIDNVGTAAVQGTFTNSPEGSVFQAGAYQFRLSYVGGTGNDVTLTRLAGVVSSWGYQQEPTEHGGFMLGAPSLSSWGAGRIDGWAVGGDRQVWHRWQSGASGAWEPLGGISLSTPAGVSQQVGQADVFIRGADNGLWMRSFRGGWGAWQPLGGIITEAPAVTSPSPGNVAVAARGGDGGVWLRRMVNNVWQPWVSLGGRTGNAPAITDWGDGRLDVWIRGLDGALWQQSVINGAPQGWQYHGGVLTDGPAAASSAPGDILLLVRGSDGLVYERSWEEAGWTSWRRFDLPVDVRPAATGAEPGHIYIGARGFDGSLWTWHAAQDWSDLASAGAASAAAAGEGGSSAGGISPGRASGALVH